MVGACCGYTFSNTEAGRSGLCIAGTKSGVIVAPLLDSTSIRSQGEAYIDGLME